MCGILGLWHPNGESIDCAAVMRASALLRHRGPDDEGYLLADTRARWSQSFGGRDTLAELNLPALESAGGPFNLALAFRRLSILDLSGAGHQPMSSADGRYTIVFNGEIYNYVELRDQLVGAGHSFHSTSDSEVLLHALIEWGVGALPRLNGMFAFAFLDRDAPRLLLARDCFGIKPLYLVRDVSRIAFASEIESLLDLTGLPRRANPQRLYNYLRFGLVDDGDQTMFNGIEQLPAAHYLELTPGNCSIARPTCYWRIDPHASAEISFERASDHLRDLFLESVRLHLRSDVPVGACLSGGIDSSAIVCTMRAVAPRTDIHAFSYCADDPMLGEERWVDLVASHVGATVHKIRLDQSNLITDLDSLMQAQQEPFGSTSIYAQHRVFRLAADAGIKVMLDGQGADELFAGYRPYYAARLASLFRQGHPISMLRFAFRAMQMPGITARQLAAETAGLLLPDDVQESLRGLFGRERIPPWIRREWFESRHVSFELLWRSGKDDALREMLLDAVTRTNLPMLLRYEDRNSMTHSIESRVPFLTPAIAEFVFSLPENYLLDDRGVSKSIFRAAMRDIVPDAILDRRDKIGFATPEKAWLNRLRPWAEPLLANDTHAASAVLNMPAVREEWQVALDGLARFDTRLWRWVNLIAWADRYGVEFGG
ncbi:MAG: asparagine synthase (glutamine-hydrolyzing) [Planctomycetes bacterium]|nr:asparagine synthase (glutamine-hydrolyzing) [Planctomycetota bacterium]